MDKHLVKNCYGDVADVHERERLGTARIIIIVFLDLFTELLPFLLTFGKQLQGDVSALLYFNLGTYLTGICR